MSKIDNTNISTNTQTAEQALAWKRYMLKRENALPNWLIKKSMGFFFISLFACWIFFGHIPNYDLIFTAAISVVLFFFAGRSMSNKFSLLGEKKFLRSVFTVGFVVRLMWILYMFFVFYPRYYGTRHGDGADTDWYMDFGMNLSEWISGNSMYSLSQIIDINDSAIDDVAYPMILGIEYLLTGGISDVLIPYIVKSILGAFCAIYAYRIAKRHFGEGTARIAAIFVCLNPNIIYWCGSMMKEAEMVFICCLAVDLLDRVLSSNQLNFRFMWMGLSVGFILFFMRVPLAIAFFFAILVHIVLASRKIVSLGKKIVMGLVTMLVLFVGVGDKMIQQYERYLTMTQSNSQAENMEWRSQRAGSESQTYAKYAGAVVFAPLIFTIPFPTLNEAQASQLLQVQLAGGSYIKNILSFFVIMVMILFLIRGQWRDHVFILAYTCAYLGILVFSSFAQSGRFHMPIWPMLMIFAAYGVQLAKNNKRIRSWFVYALYAEVFVCLAWNWFKLAGRGMI